MGIIYPENLTYLAGSREILAEMKKSNNLLAVEDRQQMSLEHYSELGVTLSESMIENQSTAPPSDDFTMTSFPIYIKPIVSEMVYDRRKISMEPNKKIIVGRSEAVMKNCVQCPLADEAP